MLLTINFNTSILKRHSQKTGVEFGSSFSQGQKRPLLSVVFLCLPKNINTRLVRINHVMVGVLGSFRACRILDPVFQLNTSTARCLEASGGSLKTTVKELTMSQHSYAQSASSTEQHLLEISLLIGSLADCNPHFTNGLAHFINTHGTPLSDISLNDFIQLISRYQAIVNTSTSQKMEGIS